MFSQVFTHLFAYVYVLILKTWVLLCFSFKNYKAFELTIVNSMFMAVFVKSNLKVRHRGDANIYRT